MKIWPKQSTVLLERREAEVPAPETTESGPERKRLLLLIPEGSLAFRLHAFRDVPAAQNFVNDIGELMPTAHWGAFWTHDSKPVDTNGSPVTAEVVVILRDETRPDVVQIASFLDMEGAVRYLRASVAKGLDLGSVLIHWVVPVSIDAPPAVAAKPSMTPGAGGPITATRPTDLQHVSRQTAHPTKRAEEDGNLPPNAPPGVHVAPPVHDSQPSLAVRISHRLLNWPGWHGLPSLVVKAALLSQETLEEVRDDPHARARAILVVLAGAMSAGVGAAIESGVAAGAERLVATAIGWAACVFTIQIVARRLFGWSGGPTTGVVETVGLASSPALLLVLTAVPVYGPLFVLCIFAWLLVAMTVAVQASLELDRESAVLTAGVGWLLFFGIAAVAPALFL